MLLHYLLYKFADNFISNIYYIKKLIFSLYKGQNTLLNITYVDTHQNFISNFNIFNLFDKHSSESVLENYRKNGELYLCKIIIKIILSINQKLVNYIAFEQEVAA